MPSLSRITRVFGDAATVAEFFAAKLLQASYRRYRSRNIVKIKAKEREEKVSRDAEEKMRELMSGGSPLGRRWKRKEEKGKGWGERERKLLDISGSGDSLGEERNPKHKLKPLVAGGTPRVGVLESKDDSVSEESEEEMEERKSSNGVRNTVSKAQVTLERKWNAEDTRGNKNPGSNRKRALALGLKQIRDDGDAVSSEDESETDSDGERESQHV